MAKRFRVFGIHQQRVADEEYIVACACGQDDKTHDWVQRFNPPRRLTRRQIDRLLAPYILLGMKPGGVEGADEELANEGFLN